MRLAAPDACRPPQAPDAGDPLDVEDLRARVAEGARRRTSPGRRAGSRRSAPDLAPLLDGDRGPAVAAASGCGPAFCYWGWRGAGGADCDRDRHRGRGARAASRPRALIHDDVMDGSDTRRGRPAVHRRFAACTAARLAGRQRAVRRGGARSCPATCAWSGATSCSPAAGLPPDGAGRAAAPVFDKMRTELMGGQYLDVLEQAHRRRRRRRAGAAGRSGSSRRSTPSSTRCCSARRWPGPARTLLAGLLGVRAAARRGVPAARRRARRVRRPGDAPASRPATTCARASGPCSSRTLEPLRHPRAGGASSGATSATRASTQTASPRCARSSWPAARWPRSRR